ncbi:hypothetical protein ACWDBW_15385 [Streptomyces sp. NPDC001107]
MTSLDPAAPSDSRLTAAAKALIPLLAGAITGKILQQAGADEYFAQASVGAVTAVVGVLLVQRSTRQDEQRAVQGRSATRPSQLPPRPAWVPGDPPPHVVPSRSTVALSTVLAAAAFWLVDLLTTWVGLGSLGYWSGKVPTDPSAAYRAVALRSLPLLLPAIFLIAVALALGCASEAGLC